MSTMAEVVSVYAPGQHRDDHNAARFYAAFESWRRRHRATMRGPGDEECPPSLLSFLESGSTTDNVSASLGRGPSVSSHVAAPLHEARRGCSAAGSKRLKRRVKDADEGADSALST
jgi:hypothetical protein